jgi:hypothetical protein
MGLLSITISVAEISELLNFTKNAIDKVLDSLKTEREETIQNIKLRKN